MLPARYLSPLEIVQRGSRSAPAGHERMAFSPDAGRRFGVTNSAVYHLSPDGLYLDTVPAPAAPAEVVPSVP
jgi:hypothetical protein